MEKEKEWIQGGKEGDGGQRLKTLAPLCGWHLGYQSMR